MSWDFVPRHHGFIAFVPSVGEMGSGGQPDVARLSHSVPSSALGSLPSVALSSDWAENECTLTDQVKNCFSTRPLDKGPLYRS